MRRYVIVLFIILIASTINSTNIVEVEATNDEFHYKLEQSQVLNIDFTDLIWLNFTFPNRHSTIIFDEERVFRTDLTTKLYVSMTGSGESYSTLITLGSQSHRYNVGYRTERNATISLLLETNTFYFGNVELVSFPVYDVTNKVEFFMDYDNAIYVHLKYYTPIPITETETNVVFEYRIENSQHIIIDEVDLIWFNVTFSNHNYNSAIDFGILSTIVFGDTRSLIQLNIFYYELNMYYFEWSIQYGVVSYKTEPTVGPLEEVGLNVLSGEWYYNNTRITSTPLFDFFNGVRCYVYAVDEYIDIELVYDSESPITKTITETVTEHENNIPTTDYTTITDYAEITETETITETINNKSGKKQTTTETITETSIDIETTITPASPVPTTSAFTIGLLLIGITAIRLKNYIK